MDAPVLCSGLNFEGTAGEAVNYEAMVSAAEKIKMYADEMVRYSSLDIKKLSQLGANLSSEYDSLSLASVKVVQQDLDKDSSTVLRMSVLELGQQCLRLIEELGDGQTTYDVRTVPTNFEKEAKKVSKGVDDVLNALHLLQDSSHFHNIYWKFIESLENVFNSTKHSSKVKIPKIENINIDWEATLDSIISEARILYTVIKMTLLNLVSPDDEKIASLKQLLQSVERLQKLIYLYSSNIENTLEKDKLLNYSESLITLVIDLLITCNEAEDFITSTHTKAILKAAVKDVLQNLKGIVDAAMSAKNVSKFIKTRVGYQPTNNNYEIQF